MMNAHVCKVDCYRGIMYAIVKRFNPIAEWFCAYVVVDKDCYGLPVNGGITYGDEDKRMDIPGVEGVTAGEGQRVLGWDYAHFGDDDTTEAQVRSEVREAIDFYIDEKKS